MIDPDKAAADVEAFFNDLTDKQKAFVNGWEGGIWTFASSAQNLQELERNLNFHFRNAPETVGEVIPQVDGSSTPVTAAGKAKIAELTQGIFSDGKGGYVNLDGQAINADGTLIQEVGDKGAVDVAPGAVDVAPLDWGGFEDDDVFERDTSGRVSSADQLPIATGSGRSMQEIQAEMAATGTVMDSAARLGELRAARGLPQDWETGEEVAADPGFADRFAASQALAEIQSAPSGFAEFVPGSGVPLTTGSGRTMQEIQAEMEPDMSLAGFVNPASNAPPIVGFLPSAPGIVQGYQAASSALDPVTSGIKSAVTSPFKSLYEAFPSTQRQRAAEAVESEAAWEEKFETEAARGYFQEGAGGTRTDNRMTLVGESGPELALFPNGTEIVPLDRRMRPSQARRLRNRGVRGMQEGGIVFDDPRDNPLPLGIRRLQAGRSLGAPRGQLLRTAGIALPSAQARRRMLPSEREAFQGLGRMAGIPVGEFQQELGITTPSGAPRTGNARMLPLSLRR